MNVFLEWFTTAQGSNCPKDDVIKEQDDCMTASEQLGFTCANCNEVSTDKYFNRPTGCYFISKSNSYFNDKAHSSSSKYNPPAHIGGICKTSSNLIILLV